MQIIMHSLTYSKVGKELVEHNLLFVSKIIIFAPNIALSIILIYIEVNSRGNLLHNNLIFWLLQLQFHELLIFLAKRSAKEQNVRFWLVSHVMYPST